MSWFLAVVKNYAGFSGRARRKEYWMFQLFNILFLIVAVVLDFVLETYFVLTSLYSLALIIPSLAVTVRRLHDTGKSGWMMFISFIPIIGTIWLLFFLVTDSNFGENQYGQNPKESVI
ncbi:MAG: DUF805 domain-containing protein [Melioribacteraceae bacterium]|jgi:uncharacterized membrane protein YhaH (DUF805 family)|nr:DUF805 domain-containing protein [Melioribacteraceae bacterium]